ncbi:hypothetical protein ACQEVF_20875 [Nonomuraea polychroma]
MIKRMVCSAAAAGIALGFVLGLGATAAHATGGDPSQWTSVAGDPSQWL